MKDFIHNVLASFTTLLGHKKFVTTSRKSRRRVSYASRRHLELITVKRKKTHRLKPKKRLSKVFRKKIKKPKAKKRPQKILKKRRPLKKQKVSKARRKSSVKKVVSPVKKELQERLALIGEVTHYFSRIGVIVLKMTSGTLNIGEVIKIKGKNSQFTQKVSSLQIESVDVKSAKRGQLVGLKVSKKARPADKVYKVL